MSERLKLSDPNGDAEIDKITVALEAADSKRRLEQLKTNIHKLERLVEEKERIAWKERKPKTTSNKIAARKDSRFQAVGTAPSINKTPAGPCTVAVAYPTSADLSNSVSVASTVRFNCGPAYTLSSTQPMCKGDESGTGGGVRSGTVNGEVKPTGASMTVRAEGMRVVRDGDPNTMNGGNNPGIYVTVPPTSGAAAKDALASSNPPVTLDTQEEKSLFGKWLNSTVDEMAEAVKHPLEGMKGALKGIANTPSHLLELLTKAAAEQRAAELDAAAGVQQLFGQPGAAKTLTASASAAREQSAQIDLPKFSMNNSAQAGGDAISTAVQIFAGGAGLAKGVVRGTGTLRSARKAADISAAGRSTAVGREEAAVVGNGGASSVTVPRSSDVVPASGGMASPIAANGIPSGDGMRVVGRSGGRAPGIPSLSYHVETKPNEAFFWSGKTDGYGGESAAREIAQQNGGTTLEAVIETRRIKMPPWNATDPAVVKAWKTISADYAAGSSGTVRGVIGRNLRPGNVWETAELPALINNPRVTKIITIDPVTQVEAIIFTRNVP